MASTYSNLKIELMNTGEQSGLWGATTNQNLNAIQQAIGGQANVVFGTDADKTLTYTNSNADQDFRAMYLNVTSSVSLTATRNLIVPNVNKLYFVKNGTTGGQSIVVKTSAGTGITVQNGKTVGLYANGTNVVIAAVGLNYFVETATEDPDGMPVNVLSVVGTPWPGGGPDSAAIVLAPAGDGYITTSVPDGTASGGDARGLRSVDLQLTRGSPDKIAAADGSVLLGNESKISSFATGAVVSGGFNHNAQALYTVICGGITNTTSSAAWYSVIAGGSQNGSYAQFGIVLGGELNYVDPLANYGVVLGGKYSIARNFGQVAYASGSFTGVSGTAQFSDNVLRVQTTNATPTRLTSDGAAAGARNTINLANNSSLYIKGRVVARNTATGDTKIWTFEGGIKRGASAATTVLMATITPSVLVTDAGASAWALAVVADTTNGGLSVTGTGAAATTIRWVCKVETVEAMNG